MNGFESTFILEEVTPVTERKVMIPSNITFKKLHEIISIVFNLNKNNKYNFYINELKLENEFNIKIISLIRGKRSFNGLGISIMERGVENTFAEDYELHPEDGLVCYGEYSAFISFWKSVR